MGPTIMTDNTFVSPPSAAWPSVIFHSFYPPDCVSIGDTFTSNNSIVCQSWPNLVDGRLLTQGDSVVSPSSINQTPPTLPGVLQSYNRMVFEVPPGANSASIQQTIQQASAYCGQRPVVHLPYGSYSINQTVTIPANCNIQLVGDGRQSALVWAAGEWACTAIAGPSAQYFGTSLSMPEALPVSMFSRLTNRDPEFIWNSRKLFALRLPKFLSTALIIPMWSFIILV